MAITDQVQQRSDFIGTQVITRSTGKKLGVINQLWADVDQREVVVLGLRNTLVTGEQRYMDIDSIRQVGDVILVDDETAIEEINTYNYSTLINNEVITETGELLGKVRGYRFDTVSGEISGLVIASIGLPFIPSQLLSTYELPVDEIASSGPDRLVVFEGAEERLNQLTVGIMERLGLGIPPWEQDDEEDYIPRTASTSNQLGAGTSATAYTPNRRSEQAEQVWEEEEWDEVPQQARQPVYEEENWSDEAAPTANVPYEPDEDVWADKDDEYEPQELKIPERQKIPEYEREPDY
jgi:sporulation protein YlmC with PRC-barrel domain